MTEIVQLAKAIDLIARRLPAGVKMLLGNSAPPTHDELTEIIRRPTGEKVRVKHDIDADGVSRAAIDFVMAWGILDAVKWADITAAVKYYSASPIFGRDWQIYAEYVTLYGLPRSYGAGSLMSIIADKYQVSEHTGYRIIKKTPRVIAALVFSGVYGC